MPAAPWLRPTANGWQSFAGCIYAPSLEGHCLHGLEVLRALVLHGLTGTDTSLEPTRTRARAHTHTHTHTHTQAPAKQAAHAASAHLQGHYSSAQVGLVLEIIVQPHGIQHIVHCDHVVRLAHDA